MNDICWASISTIASNNSAKPLIFAGPLGLDKRHAAVRQLDTRRTHFEKAVVLEDVQVPSALDNGVVHGMTAVDLWMREATASNEIDVDRQSFRSPVKIDAVHEPRIADIQSRLEQLAYA